jgi:transposase
MNKMIIGIDVSKNDLDVAFWQNGKSFFLGKYPNNQNGFQNIYQDVETKRQKANSDIVLAVMEPTGGYEQHFAYFAFNKGWEVSLPNPGNVRNWIKGIGKRAKTDKQDAMMLAHFGAIQQPLLWKPLPDDVAELESMVDRLDDLNEMLRSETNRLESQNNRQVCHKVSQKSIQDNISYLVKQIEILEEAIKNHIDTHTHLKEQDKNLKTVPGVGKKLSPHLLVAMHRFNVLTDGNGTNKAIVAYYGLDPQPKESGISVYKRPSISRQGDRNIRHLLYMGSLGGIRGNNPLQGFYQRLIGRGKKAKVAIVASARKIIIWCWAIFRQGCSFDFSRFGYVS